ncbi:hypothetical protein BDW72DRAFT_170306 [Aspergillus terricola var. indicus]
MPWTPLVSPTSKRHHCAFLDLRLFLVRQACALNPKAVPVLSFHTCSQLCKHLVISPIMQDYRADGTKRTVQSCSCVYIHCQ